MSAPRSASITTSACSSRRSGAACPSPNATPAFLIDPASWKNAQDFTTTGEPVLASRLGYRITARFVSAFFGRVFNHPHSVFTDEMLKPELQDPGCLR